MSYMNDNLFMGHFTIACRIQPEKPTFFPLSGLEIAGLKTN